MTNRWFGIRIDFVSNLFLAAVVFSTVPLAGSLDAGLVGLGLSYTVSLAVMFQFCVRLSTEVENSVSEKLVYCTQYIILECQSIVIDIYWRCCFAMSSHIHVCSIYRTHKTVIILQRVLYGNDFTVYESQVLFCHVITHGSRMYSTRQCSIIVLDSVYTQHIFD